MLVVIFFQYFKNKYLTVFLISITFYYCSFECNVSFSLDAFNIFSLSLSVSNFTKILLNKISFVLMVHGVLKFSYGFKRKACCLFLLATRMVSVLETKNLRSRCWKGWFLLIAKREGSLFGL